MKKVLLGVTVLTLAMGLMPAHAVTSTYIRTIASPTAFGGTAGVISLPTILANPTDPSKWEKLGVVGRHARCAYLKEKEGVLPANTSQDTTTGKLGYVIVLPTTFGAGDRFKLEADAANAAFDFDIFFYSSLGKCVPDAEVTLPAGQGTVTVPVEGSGPKPDGDETPVIKNTYSRIGTDEWTLQSWFTPKPTHAIVVMPVGANGKFKLTLTY